MCRDLHFIISQVVIHAHNVHTHPRSVPLYRVSASHCFLNYDLRKDVMRDDLRKRGTQQPFIKHPATEIIGGGLKSSQAPHCA